MDVDYASPPLKREYLKLIWRFVPTFLKRKVISIYFYLTILLALNSEYSDFTGKRNNMIYLHPLDIWVPVVCVVFISMIPCFSHICSHISSSCVSFPRIWAAPTAPPHILTASTFPNRIFIAPASSSHSSAARISFSGIFRAQTPSLSISFSSTHTTSTFIQSASNSPIYFKGHNHILSYFYPYQLTFPRSETLYQYNKAVEYLDHHIASKIRKAQTAKLCKKNFKQENKKGANLFSIRQQVMLQVLAVKCLDFRWNLTGGEITRYL